MALLTIMLHGTNPRDGFARPAYRLVSTNWLFPTSQSEAHGATTRNTYALCNKIGSNTCLKTSKAGGKMGLLGNLGATTRKLLSHITTHHIYVFVKCLLRDAVAQ